MKSPKNWIIVTLAGALALSIVMGGFAQTGADVTVEMIVWQDTDDPERHYVSARLAGGSWRTHGTVEVELDQTTRDGRWRYAKHTFDIPVVATCASGIAVPDPHQNPALVEDCEHLLKLQDGLSLDLYFETAPFAAPLNWSPERPMASWVGVTMEGTPRRVTSLHLPDLEMSGMLVSLSGSLAGLTELRQLRLNGNSLRGPFTSNLGQLRELTHLYLAGNDLTGCIPASLWSVANNDLATLGLPECDPVVEITWQLEGLTGHPDDPGVELTEGTYRHEHGWTFDVPPLPEGWRLTFQYLESEPVGFMRFALETGGHESLHVGDGAEIVRYGTGWFFDHIAASMWWNEP